MRGAAKKLPKRPTGDLQIDEEKLRQLAQRRAETVKAYLIHQRGVAVDRIELKPVRIESESEGDYGRVELYLSAAHENPF